MSRRPHRLPDIDMGDGWWICRDQHRTWTEYNACKLDAPGGYVIGGLSKRFCRLRDAEAWIKEWKDFEQYARNEHAKGYLASDQH